MFILYQYLVLLVSYLYIKYLRAAVIVNYFTIENKFGLSISVRKPKYTKTLDDTVKEVTQDLFQIVLNSRKYIKSQLLSLDGKVVNLKYPNYEWRFLASGKFFDFCFVVINDKYLKFVQFFNVLRKLRNFFSFYRTFITKERVWRRKSCNNATSQTPDFSWWMWI